MENVETFTEDFYIFNLDGQNYMQYGQKGMSSKIDILPYKAFIVAAMGYDGLIGPDGLPLTYTMTVQSGKNKALAMAHIISILDTKTNTTDSITPVTPQAIQGEIHYLEVDPASNTGEPFTPYVNGREVYGRYTLYSSELEIIPFLMPSGLAPQTYIFQKVKPGQYIVELETYIKSEHSSFLTCQYFFGVTLPETTPEATQAGWFVD